MITRLEAARSGPTSVEHRAPLANGPRPGAESLLMENRHG
jgi:hypothetical protein